MSGGHDNLKLILRVFGPFSARWSDGAPVEITSTKQRAMLVMLAVSPDGRRTRAWLQDMLWSLSGQSHGRASLRRALSDLRDVVGDRADYVFEANNDEIRLKPGSWAVEGDPEDGEFLEGIDIAEEGFTSWLQQRRLHPPEPNARPFAAAVPAVSERLCPKVVVLPFAGGPDNEDARYAGDMIAEEITRALSRSHLIDVISHLSSRNVNTRDVALTDLRETLDVDYIVMGRMRSDGRGFRLSTEFIDTDTGRIHWSRDNVITLAEVLGGVEDVASDIARLIGKTILQVSVEVAAARPMPDVESHALLVSAVSLMHRQSLASFSRARPQIEELIRRVPGNSMLHAWLGKWYVLSIQQGWSTDFEKDVRIASDCTARALDLDPECSFSLAVDGFVNNNLLKKFDISADRFEEALEIDPNNALAWLLKGTLHAFVDEGAKAVSYTRRARALSPLDPHKYFFDSLAATACLSTRDYEGALELADLSLKANRRHTSTLRVRTIALQRLGRTEDARATAGELLRMEPTLTIDGYLSKHPAAGFETGRDWADALRGAGVPQN